LAVERFTPAAQLPGLAIRSADPDDLAAVLAVDAICFGETVEVERPWIEPRLHAPTVAVAVAEMRASRSERGCCVDCSKQQLDGFASRFPIGFRCGVRVR
jgi:hypothetical protein